ncbi:MAG: hypothetical protein K2Y37_24425 [Pirellulales bacterium]|nr:hypothetical protein [Pirellulales bacterium]
MPRFRASVRRAAIVGAVLSITATASLPVAAKQPATKVPAKRLEITGVQAGIAGRYKVGCWAPLDVLLQGGPENRQGVVVVSVPDGDGVPAEVVSAPLAVLASTRAAVRVYVKPGREMPEIGVRFVEIDAAGDSGRVIAKATFEASMSGEPNRQGPALSDREQLIVGVGGPIGVELAARTYNNESETGSPITHVRVADMRRLPDQWYGYDGVETVVLVTSDADIYQNLTPTSPQIMALRQWVEFGGRLVVVAGSQADLVLAPGSALAQFVPGQFTRTVPLRQLRSFETLAGANTPLAEGGALDKPLLAAQVADARGQVEIREGADLPLVIRAPLGFGEVLFVAVDLDRPPFLNWPDRGRLMARLLGYVVPEKSDDESQQASYYGYSDLAGSLRSSLDQFKGVRIAPFWLVASLVFGYLLLIGPIDYLLVKRVLRRMELTWVTFPAAVIVVSAGAYFLANWMKGDELIVNQIDLIDIDLARAGAGSGAPAAGGAAADGPGFTSGAPLVRGTTWFNVFSPSRSSYNVSIASADAGIEPNQSRQLVSWMGQPGTGLGGMGRAEAPVLDWPYQYAGDLTGLEGVPIQNWSSKPFTARLHAMSTEPGLSCQLRARVGALLEGSLTNELDEPLENCLLAYRGTAYPVGQLKPGEKFEIDPGRRRDLAAELAQRQGGQGANYSFHVGYRRRGYYATVGMALPALIDRLAFYQAGGGPAWAQLGNRSESRLDGSSHLQAGQAILIGQTTKPAVSIVLDGQTPRGSRNQYWTFRRWFLPVVNPFGADVH